MLDDYLNANPGVKGLPRSEIEPQPPSQQSDAINIWPRQPHSQSFFDQHLTWSLTAVCRSLKWSELTIFQCVTELVSFSHTRDALLYRIPPILFSDIRFLFYTKDKFGIAYFSDKYKNFLIACIYFWQIFSNGFCIKWTIFRSSEHKNCNRSLWFMTLPNTKGDTSLRYPIKKWIFS